MLISLFQGLLYVRFCPFMKRSRCLAVFFAIYAKLMTLDMITSGGCCLLSFTQIRYLPACSPCQFIHVLSGQAWVHMFHLLNGMVAPTLFGSRAEPKTALVSCFGIRVTWAAIQSITLWELQVSSLPQMGFIGKGSPSHKCFAVFQLAGALSKKSVLQEGKLRDTNEATNSRWSEWRWVESGTARNLESSPFWILTSSSSFSPGKRTHQVHLGR